MKKKTFGDACFLICLLLIIACGSPVDLEKESEALLTTDEQFSQLSREQGAPAAFHEFLSADATMFPAGAEPISGLDAIDERMAKMPPGTLTWQPVKAEVAQSGELGYTWGNYRFDTVNDNGDSVSSFGKYVNVWKKQSDGTWKVLIDIGNTSPAPAQM